MYVYKQTEPNLWTVGFYTPNGVAFSTGFGDGIYNVYAAYANTDFGKRIIDIEVEFISISNFE